MAGEIFISYRRSDLAHARRLHELLKAEGIEAWYDAHVGAGEDWRTITARALSKARIFVLLFSKAASESDDISKELAAATFSKKLVVPVRLENIEPEGPFLYELASRNWINAFEDRDARLKELAKHLAGLVRDTPAPEAPTKREPLLKRTHLLRSKEWVLGTGAVVLLVAVAVAAFSFLGPGAGPALPANQTAFFGFTPSGDTEATAFSATANTEALNTLNAMGLRTVASSETIGVAPDQRLARAKSLGARYAMSGEVRADGAQATVSVRLEDVPSRTALWTQTLSGEAGDLLAVQAAGLAADTLSCFAERMRGLEGRTAELGALVAKQCRDRRTPTLDVLPAGRELARLAPKSAAIQGTLATNIILVMPSAPETAHAGMIEEAERAAKAALEFDPSDPWGYLGYYSVQGVKGATLAEREQTLKDGLAAAKDRLSASSENATLSAFYGAFLRGVGMSETAFSHLSVAVAGDPLSAPKRTVYGYALALAGRRAEAQEQFRQARRVAVPTPALWTYWVRAAVMNGVGDKNELLDHPPAGVSADSIACWRDIDAALAAQGRAVREAGARRAMTCMQDGSVSVEFVIAVLARLGDLEDAFRLAAPLAPFPTRNSFFVLYAPELTAFRADARFAALVSDNGVIDYWRETGTRPDFCATENAPVCALIAAK